MATDHHPPAGKTCERCKAEPAIVGWGTPPEWIGTNCYQEALRALRRLMRGAKP